ncbi:MULTISPECIES: DMT family transporter [unclassified Devosia]|uniref:DMT family transporter n=1 Tax=unclassified Devosia TaxID=196773 RepID=UPI0032C148C2
MTLSGGANPAFSPPATVAPLRGITLKVASVCVFVAMSALIKAAENIPAGELVFYRCFFAIVPVLVYLAWQGNLRFGLHTNNPFGHVLRGLIGIASMGLSFYGLTMLPLPEAIAIGYAAPLVVVVLGAVLLKERVQLYRWTAVIVGLVGVIIMLWPRLTILSGQTAMGTGETLGALAALLAAIFSAFAMMQVRRLVQTERTETIVLYFFITGSVLSLLTLPFGWVWPTLEQTVILVLAGIAGGVGQILLTASYRHAEMSVIAPFEYTSLLLGLAVGYFAFGDIPTLPMLGGAAIVIASGIFIIFREHRLGLDRNKARQASSL